MLILEIITYQVNLKNVVAVRKASGGEMLARIASKFS